MTGIAVAADEMSAILTCSVLQTSDGPTPGSRLLEGHMSNPPGDTTLVVWTAPAWSVECCIGLTNVSRRPGARIYTRSLAGAVAMGRFASPHLPPLPNLLKWLFSALTAKACQFREHIRQYNVALSFTSLGVQVDDSINRGGGGPPLRVRAGAVFERQTGATIILLIRRRSGTISQTVLTRL